MRRWKTSSSAQEDKFLGIKPATFSQLSNSADCCRSLTHFIGELHSSLHVKIWNGSVPSVRVVCSTVLVSWLMVTSTRLAAPAADHTGGGLGFWVLPSTEGVQQCLSVLLDSLNVIPKLFGASQMLWNVTRLLDNWDFYSISGLCVWLSPTSTMEVKHGEVSGDDVEGNSLPLAALLHCHRPK